MGPAECVGLNLLDAAWIDELDRTPFLSRCRSGEVTREELRRFVVQQYFYSRHFTRYLCALLSNIENERDRLELMENLLEEIGFGHAGEIPHSQLYRQMMTAMGIRPSEEKELETTRALVATMYECCRSQSAVVGLAALCLGAEAIVPHLYSQIVEGFSAVGEPMQNLEFFRLHIAEDDAHAVTMQNIILRELEKDPLQLPLLRLAALRLLQARRHFFEGITA